MNGHPDKQPTLRPSDVAVALCLAREPGTHYQDLARRLHLGVAEVHRGVRRLERAGLLQSRERRVNRQALLEFLVHGVRYVFPAVLGPESLGIPTAAAAPNLAGRIPGGPTAVWQDAEGRTRGVSLVPLYRAAPRAALEDAHLYRALALVDVLRLGQLQERRVAQGLLDETLSGQQT
jgi:DNA-binding Lrp family transcriptional regulator